MKDLTLALPHDLEVALRDALDLEVESAAVVLCGWTEDADRITLTANRPRWVPEEHYIRREPRELEIVSAGWVPALREAAEQDLVPVFLHTHPDMPPDPSEYDAIVDRQIAEPFRIRGAVDHYVSVIVGGTSESLSFTGRLLPREGEEVPLRRIRTVGARIQLRRAFDQAPGEPPLDAFDRQIRAFGEEGQAVLSELRVGVVGAGGTGSAVIEQLGRLGVGSLVLLDDDLVDETNLTRIHGSCAEDVGVAKVELAAARVRELNLGTKVEPFVQRITSAQAITPLLQCDVVFGCSDDEYGRIVLSRLAYWHLVPVIDMGVVLRSRAGGLSGIDGRVTYMAPDEPCLLCRGRIDIRRAHEELLDPEERGRLADEGYARGLDEPDPAVVAYTTLVGSTAVGFLLERLFDFRDPEGGSELVLGIHDWRVITPAGQPSPGHFCGDRDTWGRGDVEPRLDFTWA